MCFTIDWHLFKNGLQLIFVENDSLINKRHFYEVQKVINNKIVYFS